MNYPNICSPQINAFSVEEDRNSMVSSTPVYAINGRESTQQGRKAKCTFIFTKEEFETFLLWYYIDLKNGLKDFTVNWKDFTDVFFTEGSKMEINLLACDTYQINGLIIEETKPFKGGV